MASKRFLSSPAALVYLSLLAIAAPVLANEEDYIVVGEDYDEADYADVQPFEDALTETQTTPVDLGETNSANTTRIVGGRRIAITEAPYQAVVLYNRGLACGASVVSAVWLLTAAHCVNVGNANNYGIRAGSTQFKTGGQYRPVSLIAIHGRYNDRRTLYDLAMVRVRRRFVYGASLRPVQIPTSATSRLPSTFVISGWGLTNENGDNPTRNLRATAVNLVSNAQCVAAYVNQNTTILPNMLCTSAPGRDSCQGDSGGPLVNGGVQYGVVSFGIGCARARFPGVYTSVRSELPWIYTVARTFRNGVTQKKSLQPKSRPLRLRVKMQPKDGKSKFRRG